MPSLYEIFKLIPRQPNNREIQMSLDLRGLTVTVKYYTEGGCPDTKFSIGYSWEELMLNHQGGNVNEILESVITTVNSQLKRKTIDVK